MPLSEVYFSPNGSAISQPIFSNGIQFSKMEINEYPQFRNDLALYEVDVPGDGSCLFYSIALAYLLPVVTNQVEFSTHYTRLFGQEGSTGSKTLRVRLQGYNGDTNFVTNFRPLMFQMRN